MFPLFAIECLSEAVQDKLLADVLNRLCPATERFCDLSVCPARPIDRHLLSELFGHDGLYNYFL